MYMYVYIYMYTYSIYIYIYIYVYVYVCTHMLYNIIPTPKALYCISGGPSLNARSVPQIPWGVLIVI